MDPLTIAENYAIQVENTYGPHLAAGVGPMICAYHPYVNQSDWRIHNRGRSWLRAIQHAHTPHFGPGFKSQAAPSVNE